MIKILADKVNNPDGATVEIEGNGADIFDEAVTIIDGLSSALATTIFGLDFSNKSEEMCIEHKLGIASSLMVMMESSYREVDPMILDATAGVITMLMANAKNKKEN